MQVFLQFSKLNHAKGPILRHLHPHSARGLLWRQVPRRAARMQPCP
jgi:hypothetical protein